MKFVQVSAHSRVVFYGEGPDNAMYYEWPAYVLYLLKTFRWGRMLRDLYLHARFHRNVPFVGGLGNRLRRERTCKSVEAPHPSWIRPEMLNLATGKAPDNGERKAHPYPVSYGWLTGPLWDALFEGYDAGTTLFPVEVRHPFMDVRVIRYLLALPRIPWCRDKYLMSRAFQGALPKAVLERRKEISRMKKIEKPLKPYTSPKLYLYGDLREITRTTGANGNFDGTHAKTSP